MITITVYISLFRLFTILNINVMQISLFLKLTIFNLLQVISHKKLINK